MKKIFVYLVALTAWGAVFAQTDDYFLNRVTELSAQEGDAQEILGLLEQQIALTPKNADALFARSQTFVRIERYDLALEDASRAIRYRTPDSAVSAVALHLWRASIYQFLTGDYQKALLDYDSAEELLADNAGAELSELLLNRAQLYFDIDQLQLSDGDYYRLLQHNEREMRALIGIVRNQITRKDYDGAMENLARCERVDPREPQIYYRRALVCDAMDEKHTAVDNALIYYDLDDDPSIDFMEYMLTVAPDYAIGVLRERIAKTATVEWYNCLAIALHWNGRLAEAVAVYDTIEQKFGATPQRLLSRAACLREQGELIRALDDASRCVSQSKDPNLKALMLRGALLRELGDYEAAAEDLRAVIDLEPSYGEAYYNLGWVMDLMGREREALDGYDAAIQINDCDLYALLRRGQLRLRMGDEQAAYADFKRVLALDSRLSAAGCRQFALVYLGRTKEVEAWMDEVFAAEYADAPTLYFVACFLAVAGRADDAMQALEGAQELGLFLPPSIKNEYHFRELATTDRFARIMQKTYDRLDARRGNN